MFGELGGLGGSQMPSSPLPCCSDLTALHIKKKNFIRKERDLAKQARDGHRLRASLWSPWFLLLLVRDTDSGPQCPHLKTERGLNMLISEVERFGVQEPSLWSSRQSALRWGPPHKAPRKG